MFAPITIETTRALRWVGASRHVILGLALTMWVGVQTQARETDESEAFFENRIRPVLVKHCYECHSSDADEVGGSLWLDSSDGMKQGGDSGPAIRPGDVSSSLLISALRYESTEMPPSGKLPEHVIADFETWIASGAFDPRPATVTETNHAPQRSSRIDWEQARQFWAFQPIRPSIASDSNGASSSSMIDTFLNQSLERAGVTANESAPPSVQLRRLAFDLTGLPPSIELQSQWLADPSDEHWRRIVDSLLSSPAFGEHWGRHWLDVARYADSNGSDFNATFHDAWRYRDFVIGSFNRDRPIDEFIRQQIAGDLLPVDADENESTRSQRQDNLVATTFLMLGPKMLSERDKTKLTMDVVDEQIDTIGRAFLGLTLGCARCHDHKFDPVPTEDYYALAGIFRSTRTLVGEMQKYVSDWNRVELPVSPETLTRVKAHEDELQTLKKKLKRAESELQQAETLATASLDGIVVDDVQAKKTGVWKESTLYPHRIGKSYVHDNNSNRGQASIRFETRLNESGLYEVRLAYAPGETRSSRTPIVIETSDGPVEMQLDQRKLTHEPMWSSLGTFHFSDTKDAVVTIFNRDADGYVIADAVQWLRVKPDEAAGESADKQQNGAQQDVSQKLAADAQQRVDLATQKVERLKNQIAALEKNAPPPIPTAMAVADAPMTEIGDCNVHIRGEVRNLGVVVPRGFLQVCSDENATITSPVGSGRLELAQWLTTPDHPLVPRVFVNRVWMHLMGEGIVRTVDNFGARGELPSHPELLDALANQFTRDGWHVKSLIREIATSQAYRRDSSSNSASASVDPENRWWWRMPRRRLSAESIRDTMILVSGELDRRPLEAPVSEFGRLVSSNNSDSSANVSSGLTSVRAVYRPVVRGYVSPLMSNLDAADPDLLVGRRPTTNVPSQALVLINSPDINRWAQLTAKRMLAEASTEDTQDAETMFHRRMKWLYRHLIQREPNEADFRLARHFGLHESSELRDWHTMTAAILASTEFRLLE